MTVFTHALSTNNYGESKFIVSSSAANGTHTSITAALAVASSGDTIFIRPGTYTENLTLVAGVNLTAYGSDSSSNGTGKVIISGTCTLTTAGSVTISGIQLQTNSAALLAVTGSLASIVNLENCYLNCTNNTGITYSSSSASSAINIFNCNGNLATTGIAYFAHSSAGILTINNCILSNTGASVTNSTISSGVVNIFNSQLSHSITTSSTGTFAATSSAFFSVNNNTALTLGGTNTASAFYTQFTGGTASCVSVGSGCTLNAIQCDFNSTNTNSVTGAGTTGLNGCTFTNTSKINNVTNQSGGFATGYQKAPSAGFVGEQFTANATVNVATTTTQNIASITVTPGVWDISGMGELGIGSGTVTISTYRLGINTTSATMPGSGGVNQLSTPVSPTASSNIGICISAQRYVFTTSTTVYLVATATYAGGGTAAVTGYITATRVG